jgi:plasmid stability protein
MSISLTISNLDDETFRRLQAEAQRRGSDIESVAKTLLAENLPAGMLPTPAKGQYRDASSLAGTWSEQDYQEFMTTVAEFGRIDPEAWQ